MNIVTRFESYSNGAADNVVKAEAMLKKGIKTTYREGFDILFKAFVSGENRLNLRKDLGLNSCERDLAKLYAKYFLKILDMHEGYSFKQVKNCAHQLITDAWLGGLLFRKYKVNFEDRNGVLMATVKRGSKDKYEFQMHDEYEVAMFMITLVSLIGSDPADEEDISFYRDYIYNEYEKLLHMEKPEIYTESMDYGLKYMLKAEEIHAEAKESRKKAEAQKAEKTAKSAKIIQYRVG